MMKIGILGLALCVAAVPAAAQRPASPGEMAFTQERVEGAHPAAVLLANHRALGLTPEQVAGLDSVHARMRPQNREHWNVLAEHAHQERIHEEGGGGADPARREALRASRAAADAARAQIRQNADLAAEEAVGLLTEAQRAHLPRLAAANGDPS